MLYTIILLQCLPIGYIFLNAIYEDSLHCHFQEFIKYSLKNERLSAQRQRDLNTKRENFNKIQKEKAGS